MIIKSLLLLSVFLVPVIRPASYFGYEQTKVFFLLTFLSLAGVCSLGQGIRWTRINQTAGLFILILLVTSLTGTDLKSSLLGREPYFQGWIVYAYLFLFSLLISSAAIKLENIAVILTGSAVIVTLVAIQSWIMLNIFNIPVTTYAGRVVSTFGQPNFYAGFLLLVLPFAYLLLQSPDKKLRYLGWGSELVSLVGILLSYSRSAIALSLLLAALVLINQLKNKFKIGLLVLGVVLLGIFAVPAKESVEKRAYIWPQALKIGWQKPITGYGLENVGKAFSDYFEENKHSLFEENLKISPVLISLKDLNIDRSHNYILDLLLFSGIPGLLGWLGLVGVLFWKLGNTKYPTIVGKSVLMVSLVTYLVWAQFQNQSVVHLLYFWLLVGLIDD